MTSAKKKHGPSSNNFRESIWNSTSDTTNSTGQLPTLTLNVAISPIDMLYYYLQPNEQKIITAPKKIFNLIKFFDKKFNRDALFFKASFLLYIN